MLRITPALKKWLTENCAVKADAEDSLFRKAALEALVSDKLTDEKLVELTADPDAKAANELEITLKGMNTLLAKMAGGTEGGSAAGDATQGAAQATQKPAPSGERKVSDLEKAFAMSESSSIGSPNHKPAHKHYDAARKEAFYGEKSSSGGRHQFAGQRVVVNDGASSRAIDHPSQLDKAIAGAFLKFQVRGQPMLPKPLQMTDHEKELMAYALSELEWSGTIGGDGDGLRDEHLRTSGQKLTPRQQKAILDDATSGGLYSAPMFFDDQVVLTPFLYGEYFPSVKVVPITRGRRIESASLGALTLTGGGADGTDIPLFTTTAFIAAFNTTIFTVNGGVEIGMDFLSDSPVDVGGILTEQYGQVLLNYLDRNIAAGDGTTQPTGITVASGTVSVSGGSAAPTVGVYESFLFSIAKKYKQGYSADRIMFGANETTYSRARAIAVSGSDARRIFGMTHEDYMLFGHKYGISDTLANTKAFFGNMARYRMYRRLGQTVKVSTEGKTLVRGNLMLLTVRSRWGGQPEDGNAFGVSSTMQS